MEPTIITTIVSTAAISILASISFTQFRALRRQMSFGAVLKLMDDLDDEQARKDRELIYRLVSQGVTPELVTRIDADVTERHNKYAIERTIKNLDKVGFVLLRGYGRREEAPAWIWERALNMWQRLEPFVTHFRTQPGRKTYALYFEELAKEAEKRMGKNRG
jgi:hypothetical protein